jgi:hypothetical protein
VHVVKKGSDARWFVQILQHRDARRRYLENAVPPVRTVEVRTSDRRFAAAKACRGRVSHQRGKILEHAANARVGEAGVPQSNLKSLDRVRNRAGV